MASYVSGSNPNNTKVRTDIGYPHGSFLYSRFHHAIDYSVFCITFAVWSLLHMANWLGWIQNNPCMEHIWFDIIHLSKISHPKATVLMTKSFLQVLIRDPEDEVQLTSVSSEANKIPPWALVVGHTFDDQPIMLAIADIYDEPNKMGQYTNGSSYAEIIMRGQKAICVSSWKIVVMKPCKIRFNI